IGRADAPLARTVVRVHHHPARRGVGLHRALHAARLYALQPNAWREPCARPRRLGERRGDRELAPRAAAERQFRRHLRVVALRGGLARFAGDRLLDGQMRLRRAIGPASRDFLGHPGGLAVLFATESWERFSYFGNAALVGSSIAKYR